MVSVAEDFGAFDVDAEFLSALQYSLSEAWFQVFRAIPEICFGGAYVRCVGHGVFSSLRESEHGVGELFLFFVR